VGVGLLLAEAAFHSAIINVKINLNMIKDENTKKELSQEIENLNNMVKGEKEKVLEIVLERL